MTKLFRSYYFIAAAKVILRKREMQIKQFIC